MEVPFEVRLEFKILVASLALTANLWADPLSLRSPPADCVRTVARLTETPPAVIAPKISDQFEAVLAETFPGHQILPLDKQIPSVKKVVAADGETFVAKTVQRNEDYEREALAQEALLLGKLPASHFVRLQGMHPLPSADSAALPFFWMEYLPDGSVADHLKELGPRFPPLAMLKLFRQAATALSILHRLGYGHGDIKPTNYLTRKQDGKITQILLADLGSAARFDDPKGSATFTPRYLDPDFTPVEVPWKTFAMGIQRRDMAALRIMLQEMLLGRLLNSVSKDHLAWQKFSWGKELRTVLSLTESPHGIDPAINEALSALAWVSFRDPDALLQAIDAAEIAITKADYARFYAKAIYPQWRESYSPSVLAHKILASRELYQAYRAGKLGLSFFNRKDREVKRLLSILSVGRTYREP